MASSVSHKAHQKQTLGRAKSTPNGSVPSPRDSDQAYKSLKQMIVTFELRPGTVINESRLAKQLNLSRTPLREALHRLEGESLVVSIPHKGNIVADLSLTKLREVHEIRVELEMLCGRLAAQRITAELLSDLESLLAQAKAGSDSFSAELFDVEFHDIVYRATQNEELKQMMHRLHNQAVRVTYLLSDGGNAYLADELPEYEAIYEGLKRRDPSMTSQALRKHVESFKEQVANIF